MKNLIFGSIVLIFATSCAIRQKVMDVGIVSMTHTTVPEGSRLVAGKSIEGKFCTSGQDRGKVGLFDQAIKNAQDTYKVDFITNATFWKENNCIILEGTGQKLMSQNKGEAQL